MSVTESPPHVADRAAQERSVQEHSAQEHSARAAARRHMAAALGAVDGLQVAGAVAVFGDLRGMIDAAEARRLAAEISTDGDTRAASRKAAAGGRVSKRQADRRAKAAKAVKANAELADRLDDGDITAEQLDTIATAMETDETAATDQDLIDKIAEATVDQGRGIGRDWATARANADKKQAEHDRQRKARRASTWYDTRKGLSCFKLEGDDATINELWQLIQAEQRRLYNNDGGRDLATHPRTYHQRLFDAALKVLRDGKSGAGTSPNGSGTGPSENKFADRPPGTRYGGGLAASAGKPAVVVNIDLDKLTDPASLAELIGNGPIPDSVLIDLLQRSNLFLNVRGLTGETMWWGRLKRHATRNQHIALAVRDKGCVLCGTNWKKCHAHHLNPWNSPNQGQTNLHDMALLCTSCHHNLHNTNQTLIRTLANTWTTRPATPNETPHHPKTQRNTHRHKPTRRPTHQSQHHRPPSTPNHDGDQNHPAHHQQRTTPQTNKNDPDDPTN